MNFETIIGLEVHVELKTKSKIFSASPNAFGAAPNANTSVIDLGYPGVLPVLNKEAVDFAMKAALALNCEIATDTKFDRKNYFYPDNPKAYQISQFDKPIGENGWIEVEVKGETKRIRINRLHLEEDAGKLTHTGDGYSLVDFNRQGTPLIEIVSEADMRSPEEAYAYLEKLKSIIQYTGVSDCKMEEGSLRCDANISLRPVGQEEFGTKAELKNLNSFNYVRRGLEHEEIRQEKVLLSGGLIEQETRRFDESTGETILMRVKEGSDDYRYFPEPDLLELHIDEEWKERVRASIPELLAGMIQLIQEGTISSKIAKKVFKELIENGGDAKKIVKEKGLVQISDDATLRKFVTDALDANPQSIEDFKNGKDRAIGFLVGQIMKASKGQANPPMVNKILLEEINKR